ncbi:MAG: hypothetical protein A2144_10515 [Chloroflexi bacterium RBG_16_50_9]|nr:MAG: hypothetical protein A2144_10515 [Chloroflexi bacterium RBG_16_50_9]
MKAIEKAFEILEVFLKHKSEIGIAELSNLTGLNVSTVHRIASTLIKKGYLRQTRKMGKYSLGLKILEYSEIIRSNHHIREVARPFLEKLCRSVNESANLVIWDGYQVIRAEMIQSNHSLQVFPTSTLLPPHCTGAGKAILAHLPKQELERFLRSNSLDSYTPNTITDPDELRKHLIAVKREGVAFDEEEKELGVRNVAAVIKDSDGNVVAAIGIVGPTIRLTRQKIREFIPIIKSHALEISQALGYEGK